MSVTVTQPPINIREELVKNQNSKQQQLTMSFFVGDAVVTTFELPAGYAPFQVFDGGALQREGASEDYTVATDGSVSSVVFGIPPANGNNVDISMEIWL